MRNRAKPDAARPAGLAACRSRRPRRPSGRRGRWRGQDTATGRPERTSPDRSMFASAHPAQARHSGIMGVNRRLPHTPPLFFHTRQAAAHLRADPRLLHADTFAQAAYVHRRRAVHLAARRIALLDPDYANSPGAGGGGAAVYTPRAERIFPAPAVALPAECRHFPATSTLLLIRPSALRWPSPLLVNSVMAQWFIGARTAPAGVLPGRWLPAARTIRFAVLRHGVWRTVFGIRRCPSRVRP